MIVFLTKSDASEGFEQIIDFLNAHVIQYALMVNPTIYVSCVKQFWTSVSIKKSNDVVRMQSLIDRKKNVEDAAEDANDDIKAFVKPTPPSPTPAITPPPPQQELIHSPPQTASTPLPLPIKLKLLNHHHLHYNNLYNLMISFRGCIQTGRKIVELDADKDVTLVDVEEEMDAAVQGRLPESQAKVYHLDLKHAKKVQSMQDTNKVEPAKVEEVIEVVTAAKLMTEVVTTTATTITAAQVPKAGTPKRRRGVIIQDPEETATASVILHSKDEAFAKELEAKLNANINLNDVIKQVKRKEKEDLEMLWKVVQEIFQSSEPKNFSDDFLLNTFKTMFQKPNVKGILNGDSPIPTRVVDGDVQPVAPTTAEQRLAKKNELKARGTLLMALPDEQKQDGIFISQDKYLAKILRKFGLIYGKSSCTPIDTKEPLIKDPDVKKIFRYLKGKPYLGLWYPKDSPFNLVAYSDSNYDRANLDKNSTTGVIMLELALIGSPQQEHIVVATSSTEAEYVAAASYCAQVLWIQNQLLDYGIGKGFSRVKTPLFDAMLAPQQVQDDVKVQEDEDDNEVPTAPTSPSPTPATTPLPPQQEPIPSPPQAQSAQPSSPPQQQPSQPTNILESFMTLLNKLMKTCDTLTQKVANLEQDKIAQALEITKLKQRVRKMAESQIKVYNLDLQHFEKVLSMEDINEAEPAEVEEVLEVVTTAKLITEQEIAKKQRIDEDAEELKRHLQIVANDNEDVYTEATPLASKGNPQQDLKDKGVIDSGCSRHMTSNTSYLSNFKEINGGYVASGENPKGGKITCKGTMQ
nr:hypothetical protein [Tanacetum cinerariifolium]